MFSWYTWVTPYVELLCRQIDLQTQKQCEVGYGTRVLKHAVLWMRAHVLPWLRALLVGRSDDITSRRPVQPVPNPNRRSVGGDPPVSTAAIHVDVETGGDVEQKGSEGGGWVGSTQVMCAV